MKITSKQIRKIIIEEIQLALELPVQYDDEHIDACHEPASVVDAWHPREVMPEEDAWAGGDNLESSVDWAHTAAGESNAGPHVPVESSATVDDDTKTLGALEAVIAAILGGSLHEAMLEKSGVEDSQDDDEENIKGDEEKDDDDKEKDKDDNGGSVDRTGTESQPELGEQLTLPVRNKGGWQRWSGGKDTEPAHDIYESLRQLIRHEIITEQNIECGIAKFRPRSDDVFVPTSRGYIQAAYGPRPGPRAFYQPTGGRTVGADGVHTAAGYIVPMQSAKDIALLASSGHGQQAQEQIEALLQPGFDGNRCATIYFQTRSQPDDIPTLTLWQPHSPAQLNGMGWGTTSPMAPVPEPDVPLFGDEPVEEPVYASPEPPEPTESPE